jgi:hypothetical protein
MQWTGICCEQCYQMMCMRLLGGYECHCQLAALGVPFDLPNRPTDRAVFRLVRSEINDFGR